MTAARWALECAIIIMSNMHNCFQFLMDSSSQTSYENERKKLLNRDFSEGNLRAASVLDCVLVAT